MHTHTAPKKKMLLWVLIWKGAPGQSESSTLLLTVPLLSLILTSVLTLTSTLLLTLTSKPAWHSCARLASMWGSGVESMWGSGLKLVWGSEVERSGGEWTTQTGPVLLSKSGLREAFFSLALCVYACMWDVRLRLWDVCMFERCSTQTICMYERCSTQTICMCVCILIRWINYHRVTLSLSRWTIIG